MRLTWDRRSVGPEWGPRSIAFARFTRRGAWPLFRLWRMNPDGSEAVLLTRGRVSTAYYGFLPIAWSDDGHRLLAALVSEFYDRPYAVDPLTGAARPLGSGEKLYLTEGLSRDGRLALVTVVAPSDEPVNDRVEILPYQGGPSRVVARGSRSPDWNK